MAGYNPGGSDASPAAAQRQFKGVRMRRWGKWVSEIREPQRKKRIWLGSYRSAEEAAHAYDAALLCLRGPAANLNFPLLDRPAPPPASPGRSYSTREVQAVAAAAAAAAVGRRFSYHEFMSPGSNSCDSSDEDSHVQDITYPRHPSAALSPPSPPVNYQQWGEVEQDPSLVVEMAHGMLIDPPPYDDHHHDSDDNDAAPFDGPSLWNNY